MAAALKQRTLRKPNYWALVGAAVEPAAGLPG